MDMPKRIYCYWESSDLNGSEYLMACDASNSLIQTERAEYIRADLVPAWQPIETAPKDGTCVMLGCYGTERAGVLGEAAWGHSVFDTHKTRGKWMLSLGGNPDHPPTHWMPLPEPPCD